jgi:hypothetical protein
MMSRIIRDHRVYGYSKIVYADTEDDARKIALEGKVGTHYVWEITKLDNGAWECYVARDLDCFALND